LTFSSRFSSFCLFSSCLFTYKQKDEKVSYQDENKQKDENLDEKVKDQEENKQKDENLDEKVKDQEENKQKDENLEEKVKDQEENKQKVENLDGNVKKVPLYSCLFHLSVYFLLVL
jgi:septal ring factor EnvC (AmiA/AmiB activator)